MSVLPPRRYRLQIANAELGPAEERGGDGPVVLEAAHDARDVHHKVQVVNGRGHHRVGLEEHLQRPGHAADDQVGEDAEDEAGRRQLDDPPQPRNRLLLGEVRGRGGGEVAEGVEEEEEQGELHDAGQRHQRVQRLGAQGRGELESAPQAGYRPVLGHVEQDADGDDAHGDEGHHGQADQVDEFCV